MTRAEQVTEVFVGGGGVAHLELHGRPDVDALADRERAAGLVGAEHVADEEVAAAKSSLCSSTTTPDVQTVAA